MRKVVYSVAMSLDGYVAGPNGEADWITMDPEIDFAALFARFDTVLMGRKTYEQVRAMGGGEAMPGVTSIVASRTLKPEDCPGATVIGDGLDGPGPRTAGGGRQGHLAVRRRRPVPVAARRRARRRGRGGGDAGAPRRGRAAPGRRRAGRSCG